MSRSAFISDLLLKARALINVGPVLLAPVVFYYANTKNFEEDAHNFNDAILELVGAWLLGVGLMLTAMVTGSAYETRLAERTREVQRAGDDGSVPVMASRTCCDNFLFVVSSGITAATEGLLPTVNVLAYNLYVNGPKNQLDPIYYIYSMVAGAALSLTLTGAAEYIKRGGEAELRVLTV